MEASISWSVQHVHRGLGGDDLVRRDVDLELYSLKGLVCLIIETD